LIGASTATVSFKEDRYEQTYQSNHLSHVLLTHALLNSGCIAPNGRIVSVSSSLSYTSDPLSKINTGNSDVLAKFDNQVGVKLSLDDVLQLYSRSKAAQVVWSMALQHQLSAIEGWKDITVHSCSPGVI
jgi:NAD(P)-dependent dehydrogenase (short-subunit alcohol dehydrogenase family)